jgi:hypothetical protein
MLCTDGVVTAPDFLPQLAQLTLKPFANLQTIKRVAKPDW